MGHFPNVPENLQDKMETCVLALKEEGKTEDSAIAICFSSIVGTERTNESHNADIRPLGQGADFEGREWEVTVIGPGDVSKLVTIQGADFIQTDNNLFYSCESIRDSTPLWEGVKVYDNHLTNKQFEERAGMRSVAKEWIATLVNPFWDAESKSLKATLKVVDRAFADKTKIAHDQGVLHTIGLSIDTITKRENAFFKGKQVPIVTGFSKIFSLDAVAEPAAGGRFERLIASKQLDKGANKMALDQETKDFIDNAIREALEGKQQTQEQTQDPEVAVAEVIDAGNIAASEVIEDAPDDVAQAAAQTATAVTEAVQEKAEEIIEEQAAEEQNLESVTTKIRQLECKVILQQRLTEAKLPIEFSAIAQQVFENRIFEDTELEGVLSTLKTAQASKDTTGRVTEGQTRSRVSVGMNKRDIAEIEFLRLITSDADFRALEQADTIVTERFSESYKAWQRNGRPRYGTRRVSNWVYELLGGDPFADQRAYESVTTSSMSSIVKNAMNVLLAADYAKRHLWWEDIVTTEVVDTIDQATLVSVYGLSTLSVVNEGNAYTKLPWDDNEETADFVKKGNTVGITMETLLKDKVQIVRSIPQRLSTSWFNTLSEMVAGVFTASAGVGPTLSDTGALFNATAVTTLGGHANLLTTGLSFTTFTAARDAMRVQTDQQLGLGQRLLIEPRWLLVPVELETTAKQIRNSEREPDNVNVNNINPHFEKFDVVVVPNWTDVNDWALVGNKVEWPSIFLIFLRGKQAPELFTADNETQGSMFTNDELMFKVRMMTWEFNTATGTAPVADFRPLHKSNV